MSLIVEELCAHYGEVRALRGISLRVEDGELVALLGANGAGKSTCLMSISGLVSRVSGSIRYDGREIIGTAAYKISEVGIAQVPEGRRVFKSLSVEDNLRMGGFRNRKHREAQLDYVFSSLPILAERRRQLANSLSGGQQQMLALGRALMASPRLLLLDEPSLGLAPSAVRDIYQSIRQLSASGVSILLVEQNASLALELANRAYVLQRGEVALSGTADELRKSSSFQSAYMGGPETK